MVFNCVKIIKRKHHHKQLFKYFEVRGPLEKLLVQHRDGITVTFYFRCLTLHI